MNSTLILPLLTVTLGLALGPVSGRAENQGSGNAPAVRPPAAPSNVRITVMVTPRDALATWNDIAGHGYENREAFFDGLKRLEARVDGQVRDLTSRRALLKNAPDFKSWDSAMLEMDSARYFLKATSEELRKATPDTWQQQKDKVGQAWERTQSAVAKAKFSPMS